MKNIILLALLSWCGNLFAQTNNLPETYDWFEAKYVKFKPGRAAEARQLLHNYLYKANEISGRLVLTFESDMGDWDHIAYLHLMDGPQQLSNPNAAIETKWWTGVITLAGSEQKAKEIIAAYTDCIMQEKHNLVKMRGMRGQLGRGM